MKYRQFSIQLIGLALLTIAASPSVAMRVDVHALPKAENETTLTVSVVVAPEDRGRIGTQARMRIKLIQGDHEILHRLLDVDVDADGAARAEIGAPPGTYKVEVGLDAVRGDAQGFWQGTIAAPSIGDGEAATSIVVATTQTTISAQDEGGPATTEEAPVEETNTTRSEQVTPVAVAPAIVAPKPAPLPNPEPVTKTARTSQTQSPSLTGAAPPITEPAHPAETSLDEDPTPKEEAPQNTTAPPASTPALLHETPVEFLIAFDVADENLSRAASIYQHFQKVAEQHGLTAIEIKPRTHTATSALNDLAAALATVAQPPGGATLVLVTDGLQRQPRAEWKAADATILQAGVPLLAVGLWNNAFDSASRKNLGRMAVYSGGRFYLLQPGDATASVVSFFGLDP